MRANFSNTEDLKEFPLVPRGRYLLTIVECEEGESTEGNDKWTVKFQVAEEGPEQGKQIAFITFTNTEKALPFFKNFLYACGFDVDGEIDVDPEDVIGKQVYGKVTIKKESEKNPYPDKNQISRYDRVDDSSGDSELNFDE